MTNISHISCPNCSGTLGTTEMERVIKCPFCDFLLLVEGPLICPRYQIAPTLDKNQARRKLQKLLSGKQMPGDLMKNSRFHSSVLCFVPFYELNAKRLGTVVTKEKERSSIRPTKSMDLNNPDTPPIKHENRKMITDTRVIMADVSKLEPAIELDDWGLEEAEVSAVRNGERGVLKLFDSNKTPKKATVYPPTIKARPIVASLDEHFQVALFNNDTQCSEVRIKLIYYPVWRMRYRYRGRLYNVTVDGVTGKTMAAKAPQSDRSRVLWLLSFSMMVSFLAGQLLSLIRSVTEVTTIGYVLMHLLPVIIIVGGFLFAMFGIGWSQFRYPGEIVIRGDKSEIIKLGGESLMDKFIKYDDEKRKHE